MSFLEVNGTKLFYVKSGRGMPFIALHGGLGYDHAYMRTPLAGVEDLVRVTYFDQRGNGRSDPVPLETITMKQLAEDVEAVRSELGYERVGIVGHSFGGFVALEFATTFPDRVSHLLLLDTSPGAFEPTPEELAERGDRSWITPEVEDALRSPMPRSDEEFASLLPALVPAYVRTVDPSVLLTEMQRALLKVDAMRAGFQTLAGWSVVDKLGTITAPTLVVCGRHDLQTTPECAKRLSTAIPNAELAWFENSGHFPWVEEPQAFEARLRDFLVDHW